MANEVVLWTGAGQIGKVIASGGVGATASYYYGPLQPKTRE